MSLQHLPRAFGKELRRLNPFYNTRMTNPNRSHANNPGFLATGEPVPSADLLAVVRARAGNRVLLSFSGKDSLAMWLYLRENDFDIIPYFCYSVPGLSFDAEMLDYYQRFFGTRIYSLPHPILYESLTAGDFQPPDTFAKLEAMRLPRYDWSDVEELIARENKLSPYVSAVGIRSADNIMRYRLVRQMGPLGMKKRKYWWAIWDWKLADVMAIIRRYGVKLPRAYTIWGSTGDGVDYNALVHLKDHRQDYQRFLDLFPLADIELFRYEQVR